MSHCTSARVSRTEDPVRENRTPGSVQGSPGNRCSYCDCVKGQSNDLK